MTEHDRVVEALCLADAVHDFYTQAIANQPDVDDRTAGYREGWLDGINGVASMVRHAIYDSNPAA